MKHKLFMFTVLLFTLISMLGFSFSGQTRVLSKNEVISLALDHNAPLIFYAASRDSVYKTDDGGKNWGKVFSIRNPSKKINRLYLNQIKAEAVYVLTQEGLYVSVNSGDSWQNLFKGSSDLENNCLSFLSTSTNLFLGTEEGLFTSRNQGRTWQKSIDQFSDSVIVSIVGSDEVVYLASEKGIFISEDYGQKWKRVYVTYSSEIPEEDFNDYDGEISEQVLSIKALAISDDKLYITSAKGVFFTENKGGKWQAITKTGLSSLNIRSILVFDKQLCVATDKGLFKLNNNLWQRIGNSKDIYDLRRDNEGFLLIAGDGGLYRVKFEAESTGFVQSNYNKEDIVNLFVGEPTIGQVQAAAIEYAEVNMNKIKSWRRQARLKALFPSISVGYDKTIYGSSTGAMAIGPKDWDLNFSWDVADLIWSSDQTSIDSRSRLTVQLRQDVLGQVTNLYYERQRLKAEMLLSPAGDEVEELYRNLELQQITANINSLTDNFFSGFMQRKNK